MRRLCLSLALTSTVFAAIAQKVYLGLFGGLAAYNGDLVERILPKKLTHPVIGITANYEMADHFMLRAGLSYTVLGGADSLSKDLVLVRRNLSFETKIV